MPHPDDHKQLTRDRLIVEEGFWPKFRRLAGRLPFAEDLLAAYYAATDPASPRSVRVTLFGALAYFVIPTDMLPDFIAGIGFTDDAAVLAAAVRAISEHIRPDHRERARLRLAENERTAPEPDTRESA